MLILACNISHLTCAICIPLNCKAKKQNDEKNSGTLEIEVLIVSGRELLAV